jgi:ribosomal protein S18 acetylase RimI-like enzyme
MDLDSEPADRMSVAIRPAGAADVPGIQRVAEAAWHEARAPIIGEETVASFLDEYYDEDAFDRYLANDEGVLAVAVTAEGTVVGFASSLPDDERSGTYQLGRIYVAPDRWADRIGQGLLEHTETAIRDRGGNRISLGVMQANERAVAFYEVAGYDRVDEFYAEQIETPGYTYRKDLWAAGPRSNRLPGPSASTFMRSPPAGMCAGQSP